MSGRWPNFWPRYVLKLTSELIRFFIFRQGSCVFDTYFPTKSHMDSMRLQNAFQYMASCLTFACVDGLCTAHAYRLVPKNNTLSCGMPFSLLHPPPSIRKTEGGRSSVGSAFVSQPQVASSSPARVTSSVLLLVRGIYVHARGIPVGACTFDRLRAGFSLLTS